MPLSCHISSLTDDNSQTPTRVISWPPESLCLQDLRLFSTQADSACNYDRLPFWTVHSVAVCVSLWIRPSVGFWYILCTCHDWAIGEGSDLFKDAVTCCCYGASVNGYVWVQSVGELRQQIDSAVLQDWLVQRLYTNNIPTGLRWSHSSLLRRQ
jgi:hypothetical protein